MCWLPPESSRYASDADGPLFARYAVVSMGRNGLRLHITNSCRLRSHRSLRRSRLAFASLAGNFERYLTALKWIATHAAFSNETALMLSLQDRLFWARSNRN